MELNKFVAPDVVKPEGVYLSVLSQIENQVSLFEKITLQEMDAVQLQNRMDTKMIFHLNRLPFILDQLITDYRVFEINNYRLNPYQTLYFDTEDWKLYNLHHNEKTNRYKLRFRKYQSSDLIFFEVKYKNNKGRTIKERVKVQEFPDVIDGKAKELLEEISSSPCNLFVPKLWVNYTRITFVSKLNSERVTIDINLSFKNNSKQFMLYDLVIAEVKQGRASTGSSFLKIMKSQGVRPGSISKYCLGVSLIEDKVKKNNFKTKLLAVNKILNQLKD